MRSCSPSSCALLAALGLVLAVASCKQGEGERCEIGRDCDEGLECEDMRCVRPTGAGTGGTGGAGGTGGTGGVPGTGGTGGTAGAGGVGGSAGVGGMDGGSASGADASPDVPAGLDAGTDVPVDGRQMDAAGG